MPTHFQALRPGPLTLWTQSQPHKALTLISFQEKFKFYDILQDSLQLSAPVSKKLN